MNPEQNEFATVLISVTRSPLRWRIVQWFRHWKYRARFWFVKSKAPMLTEDAQTPNVNDR